MTNAFRVALERMTKRIKKHCRIMNRIARHRRHKKYSQRQLAKLLGLKSASRITSWETGESIPSTEKLFQLEQALNAMPDELLYEYSKRMKQEVVERQLALEHEQSS